MVTINPPQLPFMLCRRAILQLLAGMPQWNVTVAGPFHPMNQWEFQDPKLEVPTIYKAYVRPM